MYSTHYECCLYFYFNFLIFDNVLKKQRRITPVLYTKISCGLNFYICKKVAFFPSNFIMVHTSLIYIFLSSTRNIRSLIYCCCCFADILYPLGPMSSSLWHIPWYFYFSVINSHLKSFLPAVSQEIA